MKKLILLAATIGSTMYLSACDEKTETTVSPGCELSNVSLNDQFVPAYYKGTQNIDFSQLVIGTPGTYILDTSKVFTEETGVYDVTISKNEKCEAAITTKVAVIPKVKFDSSYELETQGEKIELTDLANSRSIAKAEEAGVTFEYDSELSSLVRPGSDPVSTTITTKYNGVVINKETITFTFPETNDSGGLLELTKSSITIEAGENVNFRSYIKYAEDAKFQDVSDDVVILDSGFDSTTATTAEGVEIKYKYQDETGLKLETTLTVIVVDAQSPSFTDEITNIPTEIVVDASENENGKNGDFDAIMVTRANLDGKCTDNTANLTVSDRILSCTVVGLDAIDVNVPGRYEVVYKVVDVAYNVTEHAVDVVVLPDASKPDEYLHNQLLGGIGGYEFIDQIHVLSDGSRIISGTTSTLQDNPLISSSISIYGEAYTRAFIAKVDKYNNLVWSKDISGHVDSTVPVSSEIVDFEVVENGNDTEIYVFGEFFGQTTQGDLTHDSLNFLSHVEPSSDYYFAKFDGLGRLEYEDIFGTSSYDDAIAADFDAASKTFYFLGYSLGEDEDIVDSDENDSESGYIVGKVSADDSNGEFSLDGYTNLVQDDAGHSFFNVNDIAVGDNEVVVVGREHVYQMTIKLPKDINFDTVDTKNSYVEEYGADLFYATGGMFQTVEFDGAHYYAAGYSAKYAAENEATENEMYGAYIAKFDYSGTGERITNVLSHAHHLGIAFNEYTFGEEKIQSIHIKEDGSGIYVAGETQNAFFSDLTPYKYGIGFDNSETNYNSSYEAGNSFIAEVNFDTNSFDGLTVLGSGGIDNIYDLTYDDVNEIFVFGGTVALNDDYHNGVLLGYEETNGSTGFDMWLGQFKYSF